MHKVDNRHTSQLGFTLVEMAIVLIIVGLLVAGLITPLGVQRDIRDYAETRAELAETREALMGFALTHRATITSNPHLPCPDTTGDGVEDRDAAGACLNVTGSLPWATLGLGRSDSWGNGYLYSVAPAFSNNVNGFDLTSIGGIAIKNTVGGANLATAIPAAILSKGKNGFGTSTDEQENTADGNVTFVSKSQIEVAANAFDDVVVWIPPTILISRMVSAGRLP